MLIIAIAFFEKKKLISGLGITNPETNPVIVITLATKPTTAVRIVIFSYLLILYLFTLTYWSAVEFTRSAVPICYTPS